jgi:xanthine dehydrogenase YagR molybdenum-binding subunit
MLDGQLRLKSDASRFVRVSDVMRRNGLTEVTETFEARPSPEREKYTTLAHGAQFIEVKVDPDLGTVRVTRAIEVTATGKIINPRPHTARRSAASSGVSAWRSRRRPRSTTGTAGS